MPTPTLPYIPRELLFAPAEVLSIKISPDSKKLAYVKADSKGVMNLYLASLDENQNPGPLQQMTHFSTPEIYKFYWTGDSTHIVFLHDFNGSKTYQFYALNTVSQELSEFTKAFKNISAKIFKVVGSKVALGINFRNPSYHDVYVLDLSLGILDKIFENDRFSRFHFDQGLHLVLKEEIHADGSIDVYKEDEIFCHFSPEDAFHSHVLKIQDGMLYYFDTRKSDTTEFKCVNLQDGSEKLLAHDAKSDINEVVFKEGRPYAYATTWLKKTWHSFGADDDFKALETKLNASFSIISQSTEFWIVRSDSPTQIGASFYLYHLEKQTLLPLHMAKTDPKLADMLPFEFVTRDGLLLTAYVTLPATCPSFDAIKAPLPLIVLPHGGPFQARDVWGYSPYHQWLASRGYAVLSLNFRLSSGLGKKLVNAGNGEWGRKALFDLIDGVEWCIQQGITTKEKVGIMGGSYGGYSTLAALAFTPKEFALGIDIVGPSSLITVMEKVPKYWDFPPCPLSDGELFFSKGAFIKSMGGDPEDPEGRKFLASRSPLHFVEQIEKPLLIIQGDNDPIVTKEESQQIFNALKRLNKPTRMLSFSNEGHQFKHYANIDVYLAFAEKWLHDALGGEYQPVDELCLKESTVLIQ